MQLMFCIKLCRCCEGRICASGICIPWFTGARVSKFSRDDEKFVLQNLRNSAFAC